MDLEILLEKYVFVRWVVRDIEFLPFFFIKLLPLFSILSYYLEISCYYLDTV